MQKPGEIDERKVNAQQARRILDRLVGYKASPILWRSIKTGLSAGRVQTVALRLIVEREREIRAFKPQEYWTIEALLRQGRPDLRGRARQGRRPQAAAPLGRGRAGGGGRGAAACRSSSPRSRSGSAGRIRPRRSPPARCSRKRPRSSASARGAPCARRRISTRASTSARTGRSVSSPTCGPTRCACPTRAIAVGARLHRRRTTPSRYLPDAPNIYSAPRRTPGCRTRTRRSGPPTCAAGRSRSSSTSSPTSSGSTSSSGSASWRRR